MTPLSILNILLVGFLFNRGAGFSEGTDETVLIQSTLNLTSRTSKQLYQKPPQNDGGHSFLHLSSSRTQLSLRRVHEWKQSQFELFLASWLKPAKNLWNDWKFWVGLFVWLGVWAYWLLVGYYGFFWRKAVFTLGLNLLLLALCQYGLQVYCLAVIIFQSGFQVIVWWRKHDIMNSKHPHFICCSVYQDISGPIVQSLFLFLGQLVLAFLFLSDVIFYFENDDVVYTFWVFAYFAVQMSAFFNRGQDSQLGNVWPVSEWKDLTVNADELQFSCLDRRGKLTPPIDVSKQEMLARGIMGFLANNIIRDIVAFMVPIMLMERSQAMEFVVFAVSTAYICTLDDMIEKEYQVGTPLHPLDLEDIAQKLSTKRLTH